ncbi:MAG: hypothetical protein PHV13_00665 [Candidatus ainarchaeum sp.]|nr:hypothetical protein [Candidatus ainarchaeum sp.]
MQKSLTTRPIALSAANPKPVERLQLHAKTIADRKVVLVVPNVESDESVEQFADLTRRCLPTANLSPISWPTFLKNLPTLDADIIFITSMRGAPDDFGALREGLKAFRGRNHKAVVAMANAHMESITVRSLQSANLIDHVEHQAIFSLSFLAEGVELFTRRQELR